jgi:predicted kinase
VRKELAGLSTQEQAPSLVREVLYSREWTDRTYTECLDRAARLLFEGRRVLVDATFREEQNRQTFLKAAVRWGVPADILLCQAEPETVRKRLESRRRDPSDADWSVYLQLAATWEGMGALPRQLVHALSTEGSPEQALSQAIGALRQSGLHG